MAEEPKDAPAEEAGEQETQERVQEVVLLPVRNMVLFPGMALPLTIGRERSRRIVEAAVAAERPLGLLLQKDPTKDQPGTRDLYRVGTLTTILRYVAADDGAHMAVCQGQQRFRVLEFLGDELGSARIELLDDVPPTKAETAELDALFTTLKRQGLDALALMPGAPPQVAQLLETADDPGVLADLLATFMDIPPTDKQAVLEAVGLVPRLELVASKLGHLLQVLRMSKDIQQQTEETLGAAQREYYLRQQLETIRRELGETDDPQEAELRELEAAVEAAELPDEVREEVERELARLRRMPPAAGEASMIRTWIDIVLGLPWSESSEDRLDLERARKILDADHHGLEPVKRRILEFLAVQKLNPARRGPILCLVGPPGVGKTSLGKSVARALGREFVRISLGGVHDESDVRGHRRTYIGAMPGRVIDGLRRAGTNNPVFMLDEIDKLGSSLHGDPSSALLEVLDPAQNSTFRDRYLDVPFDLSKVMFVATANVPDAIPGPLRDRCEVIHLPGYTVEEKLAIARRYLVPRQLEENGLKRGQLSLPKALLREVVETWTREAGVRGLERQVAALCRHAAAKIAAKRAPSRAKVKIEVGDLREILGPRRYEAEVALRTSQTGVATGLAWTPFGGDLLFIEATRMPGGGRLILTGQLGDVMRESAQAAVSLLRNRAAEFGIEDAAFASHDLHVHVPAGAVPKDGPSAGVAIFVALTSLFTGRKVRSDVAMTGEISLRGLVLPVGGIRDKLLAAHAAGLRDVLLPARNREDFDEVPEAARKDLRPVWLESVDDALVAALVPERAKRKATKRSAKTRSAKAKPRKASSSKRAASKRAARRARP